MKHIKNVKTTGTVNLKEMIKKAAKKKPPSTPLPKNKKGKDGKT